MSAPISVEPGEVEALAGELSALAADLADDVAPCHSAAASFRSTLGGTEGWTAGAAAAGWAVLTGLIADRAEAVAATLRAAAGAYRALDDDLAGRIADGDRAPAPSHGSGPR